MRSTTLLVALFSVGTLANPRPFEFTDDVLPNGEEHKCWRDRTWTRCPDTVDKGELVKRPELRKILLEKAKQDPYYGAEDPKPPEVTDVPAILLDPPRKLKDGVMKKIQDFWGRKKPRKPEKKKKEKPIEIGKSIWLDDFTNPKGGRLGNAPPGTKKHSLEKRRMVHAAPWNRPYQRGKIEQVLRKEKERIAKQVQEEQHRIEVEEREARRREREERERNLPTMSPEDAERFRSLIWKDSRVRIGGGPQFPNGTRPNSMTTPEKNATGPVIVTKVAGVGNATSTIMTITRTRTAAPTQPPKAPGKKGKGEKGKPGQGKKTDRGKKPDKDKKPGKGKKPGKVKGPNNGPKRQARKPTKTAKAPEKTPKLVARDKIDDKPREVHIDWTGDKLDRIMRDKLLRWQKADGLTKEEKAKVKKYFPEERAREVMEQGKNQTESLNQVQFYKRGEPRSELDDETEGQNLVQNHKREERNPYPKFQRGGSVYQQLVNQRKKARAAWIKARDTEVTKNVDIAKNVMYLALSQQDLLEDDIKKGISSGLYSAAMVEEMRQDTILRVREAEDQITLARETKLRWDEERTMGLQMRKTYDALERDRARSGHMFLLKKMDAEERKKTQDDLMTALERNEQNKIARLIEDELLIRQMEMENGPRPFKKKLPHELQQERLKDKMDDVLKKVQREDKLLETLAKEEARRNKMPPNKNRKAGTKARVLREAKKGFKAQKPAGQLKKPAEMKLTKAQKLVESEKPVEKGEKLWKAQKPADQAQELAQKDKKPAEKTKDSHKAIRKRGLENTFREFRFRGRVQGTGEVDRQRENLKLEQKVRGMRDKVENYIWAKYERFKNEMMRKRRNSLTRTNDKAKDKYQQWARVRKDDEYRRAHDEGKYKSDSLTIEEALDKSLDRLEETELPEEKPWERPLPWDPNDPEWKGPDLDENGKRRGWKESKNGDGDKASPPGTKGTEWLPKS